MLETVYAVLLHWRNYNDTKRCLHDLTKVTYSRLKIIVVDNASGDGSVERLKEEFRDVLYIQNDSNLGFSCGVNVGIRRALERNADYVLILNNDMVVEPDFLEPALEVAKNTSHLGAITGKILYQSPKDMIWHAGGHIDPWRVQGIARGNGELDFGQYDQVTETGWASGAMSLIPRKTFELVGLYPEEHFFGQEEWDLSTAILKNSLKIVYVPLFTGKHRSGGSYKGGHPILNVYGGYLSKMIYAEKYMSKIQFKVWKFVFYIYLKTRWRKVAWNDGCKNIADFKVKYNAGLLAFKHHRSVKKVTLAQLKLAAEILGPAPSWSQDWASDDD